MWAAVLAACAAVSSRGATTPHCRCLPHDPCWESVPWGALNISVGGRLFRYEDEVAPCLREPGSEACTAALKAALGNGIVDNHYLSNHPGGLQHTGHFGAWNITTDHPAFIVRAETEGDVVAAVRFAHEHNLRLSVKNTGHDWYGRSTAAGSLMVWTHNRKAMRWHQAYSLTECQVVANGTAGVPAVTVESGVQFFDLYPAAQDRGRVVIGGTCDSVGAAGCWLSGCYGAFSKKFGAGALNILSARVVLANGSVVTASRCSHPDLYWSLRGGGGGVAGVVTEFTVRTHPAPRWLTGARFAGNVTDRADFVALLEAALAVLATATREGDQVTNGGLGFGSAMATGSGSPDGTTRRVYTLAFEVQGYESNVSVQRELLAPLVKRVRSLPRGKGMSSVSLSRWDAAEWDPKTKAAPWYGDSGGDKSASTVSMMSRFIPLSYISGGPGRATLAAAWAAIADELPTPASVGIMLPKSQGGLPAALRAEFEQTALNPVLLDTAGTLLQMTQLPWFAQLPPSPTLLDALWPRLNASVPTFADAARVAAAGVTAPCRRGASGDVVAAAECFGKWQRELVPAFQRRTDRVRQLLREALPNNDITGRPFSGAYWSETDYFERDFQLSYWGAEKYARLLKVKAAYDPHGLFVCRHCVGSEFWTEASHLNCRNTSRPSLQAQKEAAD